MDVVYIDKSRDEIQEQKEVPACYTGTYRDIWTLLSGMIHIEYWEPSNVSARMATVMFAETLDNS
jgi:hypothetical protein